MKTQQVKVYLYRDGNEHSNHMWSHVPRVGDEISLYEYGAMRCHSVRNTYRVMRVIWDYGNLSDMTPHRQVSIEIEKT